MHPAAPIGNIMLMVGTVTKRKIFISEHDPEKWAPVFGKDHAQNKIAKAKCEPSGSLISL